MVGNSAEPKGNDKVYGLIVAGGMGTRLWPLSRADRPKQFLPLDDGPDSLLQNAFARLARTIPPERIKIVTSLSHHDQVLAQIRETQPQYPPENILGEPVGKNSAPAILWGALHTSAECPEASKATKQDKSHCRLCPDRHALSRLRRHSAVKSGWCGPQS